MHPTIMPLSAHMGSVLSARYFYIPHGAELLDIASHLIFARDIPPITPIPCRRISSLHSDAWDGAFCVVSASPDK